MSPSDCIFCRIVRGEIPCAKLYETDTVLAFLDIAPVKEGHALVIPKAHHPEVWDLPAALGGDLVAAVGLVGRAVLAATGCEGVNVLMNNREAAGQLVPHAHFHVIPRKTGDGLALWPQHAYENQAEMSALAQSIRSRLT